MPVRTCQLHLRYPDTFGGTASYVQKLVDVFDALNTDIDFVEASSVPVGGGRLDAVDAGSCNGGTSTEVEALFDEFAPVPFGDDDVMVFFADRLTGGARLGCAHHPADSRGVIVSCQAREMVLPHEIGHLFLGDVHDHHDTENLMFRNSDQIDDPPRLTGAQRSRIRTGAWASVTAPPIFMGVEVAEGAKSLTTAGPKKKRRRGTKTARKKTPKKTPERAPKRASMKASMKASKRPSKKTSKESLTKTPKKRPKNTTTKRKIAGHRTKKRSRRPKRRG